MPELVEVGAEPLYVFDRYWHRKPFAKGGEATIHEGIGNSGEVIKLGRPNRRNFTEERARFCLEVEIASLLGITNLAHPNVVGARQFTLEGAAAYTMQRYAHSLADRLSNQSEMTRLEDDLRIARGIFAGVAHLHGLDIVHRDVKPGNVLIGVDDDGNDTGVVSDYGIVLPLPDSVTYGLLTPRSKRTVESQISDEKRVYGTPLHMSPEQTRDVLVDPSSDVYSAHTVLYEMLIRTPYHNQKSQPFAQMMFINRLPKSYAQTRIEEYKHTPRLARIPALLAHMQQGLSIEPDARPSAQQTVDVLDQSLEDLHKGPLYFVSS